LTSTASAYVWRIAGLWAVIIVAFKLAFITNKHTHKHAVHITPANAW
jgi:hypothetical protein